MDLTNILIIVSAVVVVFLMWLVVGVRHLKNLKTDICKVWHAVDKGLRKRQDLVPLIIEVVRGYVQGQEKLVDDVIIDRLKAAKESEPGSNKVEYEHDLTGRINQLFSLAKGSPDLKKDVYFQELKKEVDELEKKIENDSKEYNRIVRIYNGHRKSLVLVFISAVLGYGNVNIFEFEL